MKVVTAQYLYGLYTVRHITKDEISRMFKHGLATHDVVPLKDCMDICPYIIFAYVEHPFYDKIP